MTSRAKSVLEQALELTADERADVASELLASLSTEPVEVPAWHREILEKRLADLAANPTGGRSWDAVLARLTRTSAGT